VNGAQYRRLRDAEIALGRLADGGPVSRLDALARRDPSTMTDSEAVEAWRHLAKRQGARPPPTFSPQEEAALVAEWRELTA
jgi:hypothetical protein